MDILSLRQNDKKKQGFFACWYRLMENESQLKSIVVGIAKNWSGHYGLRNLKLAVSLAGINWMDWFFGCW